MSKPIQILPSGGHLHHSAVTVPDLSNAVELLLSIFEGEEVFRARVTSAERDLAVDFACSNDAEFDVSMLKLGSSHYLELFTWSSTDPTDVAPSAWMVGGHHVGFEVANAEAAYRFLETVPQIALLGRPKRLPADHPLGGATWFYLETTWGLRIELLSRD